LKYWLRLGLLTAFIAVVLANVRGNFISDVCLGWIPGDEKCQMRMDNPNATFGKVGGASSDKSENKRR
jgi:hypothetical protein